MDSTLENMIYNYVCLSSSIICIVLAYFLLDTRDYQKKVKAICPSLMPQRYINARKALGIAYVVAGLFTAGLLLTEIPHTENGILPLCGLVISSSQVLLFTVAILSFYNSPRANYRLIWGNIIPILLLFVLHILLNDNQIEQERIRVMWMIVYCIQLMVFIIFFFYARNEYKKALHQCLGDLPIRKRFEQRGLFPMFLGMLFIGVYSLFPSIFTQQWMLTVFILTYTSYYFAVGIYALRYARNGHYIKDISESVD